MSEKGYEAYVEETQAPADENDLLSRISTAALSLKEAEKNLADQELAVKKAKSKVRDLQENILPALFREAGWDLGAKIQTKSGLPLSFEKVIHTSIAGNKKPSAIQWLDDHGHGGMVSRKVEVVFNKTEQKKVDALLRLIGRSWKNIRTVLDVNGTSVKALIKKLMENGEEIPLETFGVHEAEVVKISSK